MVAQLPLDVIAVGNYRWVRLKQQLAAIEDTPDLSEPLGLPMREVIAAPAARALVEKGNVPLSR
jgi:hypothetical protein